MIVVPGEPGAQLRESKVQRACAARTCIGTGIVGRYPDLRHGATVGVTFVGLDSHRSTQCKEAQVAASILAVGLLRFGRIDGTDSHSVAATVRAHHIERIAIHHLDDLAFDLARMDKDRSAKRAADQDAQCPSTYPQDG